MTIRCILLLLPLYAAPAAASDLFVDASATTGAGDGSSWADAFQGSGGLQAALAVAAAGDRIFVASGNYLPSATGDRSESFELATGVELYGGCSGVEAQPDERPVVGALPSVLSGDLAADDGPNFVRRSENSRNVVHANNTVDATAILDGFVIRGGNADGVLNEGFGGGLSVVGGRPTIRRCVFTDNSATNGGGAADVQFSNLRIAACRFEGNESGGSAGALSLFFSSGATIESCDFRDNESASSGGAAHFELSQGVRVVGTVFWRNDCPATGGAVHLVNASSATFENCAIVGNTAGSLAAGVTTSSSQPIQVDNCILRGNLTGGVPAQLSGGQIVSYSIVEGIAPGGTNLDVDPMFVDPLSGDLRLAAGSPAIDAGSNALVTASTDRDGARRRRDDPATPDTGFGAAPIVDIGPFEFTSAIGELFCTAVPNSTGAPGRLDAFGSLVPQLDDVELVASDLPASSFGVFLVARTRAEFVQWSGSAGTLCLAPTFRAFTGPGAVQRTGATGEMRLTLDLTVLPTPGGVHQVLPGEAWCFQAWHRDSMASGATSNFTDGVRLAFE